MLRRPNRHRQQRRRNSLFDHPERHQQDNAEHERDQHGWIGPGGDTSGGDAVDDGQQAAGHGHGTGQVEPGPPLRPTLGRHDTGGEHREHRDRDVDEERPPPAQQVGEHATEDCAGGEASRHQRAVQALVPGRALLERRGQQ
jgi:hypothetical protein